jgi:hypothetical protein
MLNNHMINSNQMFNKQMLNNHMINSNQMFNKQMLNNIEIFNNKWIINSKHICNQMLN